jgi:hypothetical protein
MVIIVFVASFNYKYFILLYSFYYVKNNKDLANKMFYCVDIGNKPNHLNFVSIFIVFITSII